MALTALERVGMTDAMDRQMGTYSLGMRQRTKIAQAIAHEPDFLILDEPYNGLDPVGRSEMTSLLKSWTEEGRGLLFASHVLQEIESITSSFLLIHGGRLLASGTAREIETMLAGTPQEVSLVGSDVRHLIKHLAKQDWVRGLELLEDGGRLRLSLTEPRHFYQQLPEWITAEKLSIERLEASDGNLEAIFDSLLKHHRGEAS